jgi:replication factor C small subunit
MTKTDWTEKYRPNTLDEIVGNEDIVAQLEQMVEQNDLQSCIFAGPPGVGKTTAAVAIARGLYGEHWQELFKELNASDARGIDVVRDEVKEYSRQSRQGNAIIFLDEADALTDDAQAALRRVMEKHTSSCTFILSCNYPSKIIPAIQSRCMVSKFSRVDDEHVRDMLLKIKESEDIDITDDALDVVVQDANGDIRSAINILQALSVMEQPIDVEQAITLTFNVPDEQVESILTSAVDGDFSKSISLLEQIMDEFAVAPTELLDRFYDISWNMDMTDRQRQDLVEAIGDAEYRVNEGCDPYIQLSSVLATVSLLNE